MISIITKVVMRANGDHMSSVSKSCYKQSVSLCTVQNIFLERIQISFFLQRGNLQQIPQVLFIKQNNYTLSLY